MNQIEHAKAFYIAHQELMELHELCADLTRLQAYCSKRGHSIIDLTMVGQALSRDVEKQMQKLDEIRNEVRRG